MMILKLHLKQLIGERLLRRSLIYHLDKNSNQVALSFDGGPYPDITPKILEVLYREKIKATFFLVGTEVERYPDLATQIVQAGHEVGNHSFSHKRLAILSRSQIDEEVRKADATIQRLTGTFPVLIRPPYGSLSLRLLYYVFCNNRKLVMWSTEGAKWNSERKKTVSSGEIILMHDDDPNTLEYLKLLIPQIKKEGLGITTIGSALAFSQNGRGQIPCFPPERFQEEGLSHARDTSLETKQRLYERLYQRVPIYYPTLRGVPYTVTEVTQAGSSYPLIHLEISSPGVSFRKDIFVKFAPVTKDRNEGLSEFENLRAIKQHSLSQRELSFGSPVALDFWEDINALVTEGVQGIPLRTILLRHNRLLSTADAKDRLRRIIHQCAQWLKNFHLLEPYGLVPFDMRGFERGIRNQLCELDVFGFSQFSVRMVERTLNNLNQWMRSSEKLVPIARQHGDMATDNILVNGNRIWVLDLSYATTEVIYRDIAYFVLTLETINRFPSSPFYHIKEARTLQETFLESYFGGVPINSDHRFFIHVYLIQEIISRCLYHYRKTSTKPTVIATLMRWWIERLYSKLVQRECEITTKIISG